MKSLYTLTDEQYEAVAVILREEKDPRGRKPKIPDRHALEGILYILREGCSWRDLPEDFGHWMAVFMRYQRWSERGVLWKTLVYLQKTGVLKFRVLPSRNSQAAFRAGT